MLNFLNTAILAAAAAAVFPFLLHLFSKRKVKIIPFSSITFLKAMQKRQVRAIKIKQVLLLVVRTLIILAVVFAFARPATRGGYIGSHAAVSAVIVIDNSASMGLSVKDGRLYDLAIKKARGILQQMGQSDEAAVVTTSGDFSRPAQSSVFGNPAEALSFLNKTSLTDDRADLSASYIAAAELASKRSNLNREIYLISDFQENAFNPDKELTRFDGKTYLVELPVEEVDNSAVTGVDLGNQLIEVGTSFGSTVTVKRFSGKPNEEMLISLYLDDKQAAQKSIQLKPGESGAVDFDVMVADPGFHSGYAMLSDDDLLADNRLYFSFYIPEKFNLLLVGEQGFDTRLFQLALAPDESVRRHWSVQQSTYAQFPSINLSGYNMIILANYATLADGDIARIKEFVSHGGGLMVNIGQAVDSARFARTLADIAGVSLESSFPKDFSRAGYFLLGNFDLTHQILSVFDNKDARAQLSFKAYARIKTALADSIRTKILARWSDGSPGVTAATFGRGRVMLFNCDVNPDISDISLHPFFVPFIVRSCEYLSSDYSSHSEQIFTGSSPKRNLRLSFNISGEYALVAPDGKRRIVTGSQRDNGVVVDCGRLDVSGVYTVLNEKTESDRFAVNINSDEGDLYRTDWKDLSARFANSEKLGYSADLAGFISQKRFGRELWHYFLLAAVLLLAFEMFIARDRGGSVQE
jgi:hypothetical protein